MRRSAASFILAVSVITLLPLLGQSSTAAATDKATPLTIHRLTDDNREQLQLRHFRSANDRTSFFSDVALKGFRPIPKSDVVVTVPGASLYGVPVLGDAIEETEPDIRSVSMMVHIKALKKEAVLLYRVQAQSGTGTVLTERIVDNSTGHGITVDHLKHTIRDYSRQGLQPHLNTVGFVQCVLNNVFQLNIATGCSIFLNNTLQTTIRAVIIGTVIADPAAVTAIVAGFLASGVSTVLCGQVQCALDNAGNGGSFSLSATPSSLVVAQGQMATYTIAVTYTGGYASVVNNFSVSNLFAGARASFSPSQINYSGGTTTLTIDTSAATDAWDRIMTISANNGRWVFT